MPKERACANRFALSRRTALTGLITSPLAVASIPMRAEAAEGTTQNRMIRVIEQLEAWQGWELSNIIAAKAFAAWQARKALGLDLPDPQTAQMHIEFQRQNFEAYQRSVLFERDLANGKRCELAAIERALV